MHFSNPLFCLCLITGLAPGQSSEPAPAASAPEKAFYRPEDRITAIHNATIYAPRAVAEANIREGPPQKKKQFQLHFNDKVVCDFVKPGAEKNGNTPKFDCKITRVESADGKVQELTETMDEQPVKVKFGQDNREIYAEVASTRLLWALGFFSDSDFPVRVECHNCPSDPMSGKGSRDTRMYDPATIERKSPGHKMTESGNDQQGWSWKEFEAGNGRPSREKDALKLIAAFIIHSDNKPPQQRLVCDGVNVDQSTSPFTTTCKESRMLIQDVGATFGGGGAFTDATHAKMNLHEWSGKNVWKKVGAVGGANPPDCQATLPKSLTAHDGLGDPMISEEGRRFAAGLMCQLTDAQLADLFATARVSMSPDYRNHDGSFKSGFDETKVVSEWVDAFKKKREQIAAGRCKWKNEPADLTAVDNPAGLPTVPNNCSAKLF